MLNWDDFHTAEDQPSKVEPAPVAEDQQAAPSPQPVAPQPAPVQAAAAPSKPSSDNGALAAARRALESLDPAPVLSELDMGAARFQVDDKQISNRRADLYHQLPINE